MYQSSSEYGDDADSRHADRRTRDEQKLYGEPCHEVRPDRREQKLYGEPQHETHEADSEPPDLELLFARMRAEAGAGPASPSNRSSASPAETTEQ